MQQLLCSTIPRMDHLLSHSIHRMKENGTNFAIIRNNLDTILYKGWLCAQGVEWFGEYIADRPYTFSQHLAENRCSNAESAASSSCCTSFILRLKCSECTPTVADGWCLHFYTAHGIILFDRNEA